MQPGGVERENERTQRGIKKGDSPSGLAASPFFRAAFRFALSGAFGGLCAATPLGQMVPEFEEWSVDESRKYGDTGIVKSQYGYHIMFFVNDIESYKSSVITAMREAQINELINGVDKNIKQSKADKLIERFAEINAAKNEASAQNNTAEQENTITAE